MSVAESIERKLRDALTVNHLVLENESHRHAGPATESHFKLVLVSPDFEGLTPVKRHQRVYKLVAEEMAGPVHALALHLYTPEQWAEKQQAPASPNCMGGEKNANKAV